jgi:ribosomal protein S18 acetylase RimI-like enzyme
VKIVLRTYRPDDFDALHRIDVSCYSSDVAYSRSELRTYMAFPGAAVVVAEVPGGGGAVPSDGGSEMELTAKIIGFCLSIHRGGGGHIITMDVLKEWRRHGVGSALLEEAEKRLARAGVDRVELETATDNAAGIAFWRSRGYRACGVKRGYYPRGVDAYAMAKSLVTIRP